MFPWLKDILHETPMFVPTRRSILTFANWLFLVLSSMLAKDPPCMHSLVLVTCPAAQQWPGGSFSRVMGDPAYICLSPLCFWEHKLCCLLSRSYLMVPTNHLLLLTFYITWHGHQLPFTEVRASNNQLLLKSPLVWSDWWLKPYETNTFLVVLSMHSKWAQIGCKFNPDLETSANVPVNLIQPSGFFHPVSGFIVKVLFCPTHCPNKPCLKWNKDISKNEEPVR